MGFLNRYGPVVGALCGIGVGSCLMSIVLSGCGKQVSLAAESSGPGSPKKSSAIFEGTKPTPEEVVAIKAAISKQYAVLNKAWAKKDLTGLVNGMTFDAVWITGKTVRSRSEFKDVYKGFFKLLDTAVISDFKITNFKICSDCVVARVQYKTAFQAKNPPDLMISTFSNRDTWVKTPKGWRIHTTETKSTSATVNGKPYNAKAVASPKPDATTQSPFQPR